MPPSLGAADGSGSTVATGVASDPGRGLVGVSVGKIVTPVGAAVGVGLAVDSGLGIAVGPRSHGRPRGHGRPSGPRSASAWPSGPPSASVSASVSAWCRLRCRLRRRLGRRCRGRRDGDRHGPAGEGVFEPVAADRFERHGMRSRRQLAGPGERHASFPVASAGAHGMRGSSDPDADPAGRRSLAIAVGDGERDGGLRRAGARGYGRIRESCRSGRCRCHQGEEQRDRHDPRAKRGSPTPTEGGDEPGSRARGDSWGGGRSEHPVREDGAAPEGGQWYGGPVRPSRPAACSDRSLGGAVDCGVADGPTGRARYPRSVIETMGAREGGWPPWMSSPLPARRRGEPSSR